MPPNFIMIPLNLKILYNTIRSMKKIPLLIHIIVILSVLTGCFQKAPKQTYTALVDKKILFSLSSLSIESKNGQANLLEEEITKRIRESMYFSKTKKGFVRVKIEEITTTEEGIKGESGLLWFLTARVLNYKVTYTISVVNEKYEELKKVRKTVEVITDKSEKEAEIKNTARLLDTLQSSIYEISKLEFGSFLY